MRSEGSRFTLGSGGEAVFAESCVCVRKRRQPSATVCVSAVTLSTGASAAGRGLESESSGLVTSQLYWPLQGHCLSEWSVVPQLYRRLQTRCLREWSWALQLYWRLQRRCLCEGSVASQSFWIFLAFAGEVFVWMICAAAVALALAEEMFARVIWASRKRANSEFPTKVPSKSARVSSKSVIQKCKASVSGQSFLQKYHTRMSHKGGK